MPPAMIKMTVRMERKAESTFFIPHDSNFFANGKSIKDIIKAKARGIRIGLPRIMIASSPITVARA